MVSSKALTLFALDENKDSPTLVATQWELRFVKIIGRMEGGRAQLRDVFPAPPIVGREILRRRVPDLL